MENAMSLPSFLNISNFLARFNFFLLRMGLEPLPLQNINIEGHYVGLKLYFYHDGFINKKIHFVVN